MQIKVCGLFWWDREGSLARQDGAKEFFGVGYCHLGALQTNSGGNVHSRLVCIHAYEHIKIVLTKFLFSSSISSSFSSSDMVEMLVRGVS